jgi:hypothetical protein
MTPIITNLTPRQVLLADLIWACTTREQAVTLVRSLQGQDRWDAAAIMQCMIYEVLEERIEEYSDAASAAIANCKLR